MKKRLITSALPYVNNVPHLGTLIHLLSADVFARFSRLQGYETLYICGSDEYGTATETRALEEGISPRELCDRNYILHKEIYSWFNISFDHYGRTSSDFQTSIVQDIFLRIMKNDYIIKRTSKQLYSEKSSMFLADRYIKGECPHCHYNDARGDQCENCGRLLDSEHLVNPVSIIDNSVPILKETTHFYIDLPRILPQLSVWLDKASTEGNWSRNALNMTRAWIRDGLRERSITRDLKWGIPVPLEGFEDKVFYVWFDAPIGYISISAEHAANQKDTDGWKQWWQNPKEVELFQFIGKDNIPFHTVIFPATLLASGQNWTMLHHMSSTEYINYEGGKFSKSKGIGVFGNDAQETGIPADVWRFYLFYNRPETSDYTFTWSDFQEATNKELIGNLANLVNRNLQFYLRFFDRKLLPPDPNDERSRDFWERVRGHEKKITECLEWAQLREAFRRIFALSDFGNKVFQAAEPWKLRHSDPKKTSAILSDLIFLIRDLAVLIHPYIPHTAERICSFLGTSIRGWNQLCSFDASLELNDPTILFTRLDDELTDRMRSRFSGNQGEPSSEVVLSPTQFSTGDDSELSAGLAKANTTPHSGSRRPHNENAELSDVQRFLKQVELRVAKIIEIERHPDAERLYIETLDDGNSQTRCIVSGLVPHYSEEELLEHNILLVANLKPVRLRGVRSNGMLLAVSDTENKTVEVIFADQASPGDLVLPFAFGMQETDEEKTQIDIDSFLDIPLRVENYQVMVADTVLEVAHHVLRTVKVSHGIVR